MRKIIVTEFITLDGVVEAPGGNETDHPHRGWNFWYDDDAAGSYKVEELYSVDALMLGKTTYEQFAAYWPTQTDGDFAARINNLPKYIVSHSLETAGWNNCTIIRDISSEIPALKNSAGGDILVYGSGTLVKSLLHHGLVDELRLMLHPVIVGGGQRLFNENRELAKFKLRNSQTFDSGLVMLEYIPASTPSSPYQFRQAVPADLDAIWVILQHAIERRRRDGSNQWQDGYPNPASIKTDIEKGHGFVLVDGDRVAGYTAILVNDEPAYADIDGTWLTNGDFVVYHRVALSPDYVGKGLARILLGFIEQYARENKIYSLKADTNFDNQPMLHLFEKLGYQYCGEVFFRGAPRKAFEKIIEP